MLSEQSAEDLLVRVAERSESALLKDHHRDWGPDRPEIDARMAGR